MKDQLEAEYKKEQEAYSKVRLEYDTQLTPAQKELLKEARHKLIEIKEKRRLKQVFYLNFITFRDSLLFLLYDKKL